MTSRREFLVLAAQAGACSVLPATAVGALAQESAYKVVPVANGGTIEGIARLKARVPDPDRIIIGKDNHICGHGEATPDPVVVGADGALRNAVVGLKTIAAGKGWSRREATLTQEKCAFHPYVQVAPKVLELTIHNKDPLLHNIHTYELIGRARRTLFNIAQPQAGQVDQQKIELRRGHIVEIDCDAHNWMSAWVFTSEHPYVTVTDASGRFALADVPPGTYELSAWHPVLGLVSAPAVVKARTRTEVDVAFGAKQAGSVP
jgi:hypothetical protein